MTNYRPIEQKLLPPSHHWVGNGFRVHQLFPKNGGKSYLERLSPFILMDYNSPSVFEPSEELVGIGPHPHRGFETVTLSFEGKIEHNDNKGNHGIMNSGDVQWMTAGEGILHKEYHEKEYAKKKRLFHMIQLWVNLPKKDKMTKPGYQAIAYEDMGKVKLGDGAEAIIIAGEVEGVKGPAKTFSPINMYRVKLKAGESVLLKEPGSFNTGILNIGSTARVNDVEDFSQGEFMLFENKEGNILVKAYGEDTEFVVLSGEPLNEPVVAGGPFVMNTKEELTKAFVDYESGKFGSHDF